MEMMKMGFLAGTRTNPISPGIRGLAGFEGEFEVRESNGILIPIPSKMKDSFITVARKEIIIPQFGMGRSMENILNDNCLKTPRSAMQVQSEALFV